MCSSDLKIGRSARVDLRLIQLQVDSPRRLDLIGTIPSDNIRNLERELHRRFQAHRIRGEWFADTAEIRQAFGAQ